MPVPRVEVRPEILLWACDRAGDGASALRAKFPRLDEWIRRESNPTLKQLEDFAKSARVPFAYLFLTEPPDEQLPIQDLRTVGSKGVKRPSPDLLEVLQLCLRRQEWYREYAEQHGEGPKPFVGAADLKNPPAEVAREMRRLLDFGTDARRNCQDVSEAMKLFIDQTEQLGVLVMVSGVVKNITNRPLDTEEFRGFALADPIAPIVFVNAADTKPAQIFTLAHELAHIWLGKSAVSDSNLATTATSKIEKWCNHVAAEFLVPLSEMRATVGGDPIERLDEYRRLFKVSTPVILRRLLDARMITEEAFEAMYTRSNQVRAADPNKSGGDFYNTLPVRASKRFVRALVASTLSGATLYRDAFQMLGINSIKAFRGIGRKVGELQ